jgi:DNA invertase Pin-like site-specific DNA recombinase
MAMSVFAYARESLSKRVPTVEEQRERIIAFVSNKRNVRFDPTQSFYADTTRAYTLDFRSRPAGGALWSRLQTGDALVIWSLDRAFRTAGDLAGSLDHWSAQGVEVVIVSLGQAVSRMTGLEMARAIWTMEYALASERQSVIARAAKYHGKPPNGNAPLGHRWVRRRGQWSLEPDPVERQQMGLLLAWSEGGRSVDEIRTLVEQAPFRKLFRGGSRKWRPVRWSRSSIVNRLRAERQLREQERVAGADAATA